MSLIFQSAKLAPNASQSFNFDETVYAYSAGIASFLFTFGDEDHHVQQISLSLDSNKSGPNNDQINVTVTGVLKDADGNTMDIPGSYVLVVVFAWVGSSTSSTIFSGPTTIASGLQSPPIYLPNSSPTILQGSMAGFWLNYGEDHHVQGVNAAIGVSPNGNQASLTATANMFDSSGNTAQNPTATGNLLASMDANPGFIIQPYTAQNSQLQTIPMSQSVTSAFSLLTSFKAQYDDDYHVQTIGAGPDVTFVDPNNGKQVITSGVWAFLNDTDGHSQDNSLSNCSIIVVGIL